MKKAISAAILFALLISCNDEDDYCEKRGPLTTSNYLMPGGTANRKYFQKLNMPPNAHDFKVVKPFMNQAIGIDLIDTLGSYYLSGFCGSVGVDSIKISFKETGSSCPQRQAEYTAYLEIF